MKLTISRKMLIGIALIFIFSYGITIMVISRSIQDSNKVTISKSINSHVYNLKIYIRQFVRNTDMQDTIESFVEYTPELGSILSTKYEERIIIYDHKGEFLFDSVNKFGVSEFKGDLNDDLKSALDNEIAYTILNGANKLIVAISVPVYLDNGVLGVIRYFYDYTYLHDSSQRLFQYMHISILLIFILLFVFVFYLTRRITKPIGDLSRATCKVADGDFSHSLSIRTNDEIEDLANNFSTMKNSIQRYISELNIEKDNIIRLHKHRKLFFDNVTHELKTPLTIISGYTQVLQNYDDNDKAFTEKTLAHIKDEADRMHDMVINLLEIAKTESDMEYSFETFDLSKLIIDIIKDINIRTNNKATTISHNIETNINIFADKLRIRQAIENIIDNAIKYSEDNVIIQIDLYKKNGYYNITIKDNGIGIDKSHIDNLFKPFYRVDKTLRESSGLGLYIVKSIIEAHNGKVTISSKVDTGTEVLVQLPI